MCSEHLWIMVMLNQLLYLHREFPLLRIRALILSSFFFPHFYLLEKNIISLTRLVVSVPRLNYTEGALE